MLFYFRKCFFDKDYQWLSRFTIDARLLLKDWSLAQWRLIIVVAYRWFLSAEILKIFNLFRYVISVGELSLNGLPDIRVVKIQSSTQMKYTKSNSTINLHKKAKKGHVGGNLSESKFVWNKEVIHKVLKGRLVRKTIWNYLNWKVFDILQLCAFNKRRLYKDKTHYVRITSCEVARPVNQEDAWV